MEYLKIIIYLCSIIFIINKVKESKPKRNPIKWSHKQIDPGFSLKKEKSIKKNILIFLTIILINQTEFDYKNSEKLQIKINPSTKTLRFQLIWIFFHHSP